MSIEKLPVYENFPPEKGQSKIVKWIKDKIFQPTSYKVNFLLSLVNSGFVEIPADDVNPGADGNWRWRIDGDDIILQKKVAGTWTDTAIKMFSTGNTRIGGGATYLEVENDGDTFWVGTGSGLPFGEIYFDGGIGGAGSFGVEVTNTGDAGKVQVAGFETNGFTNNCTSDHANDEIKIVKAGIYDVFMSFSASSSNNDDYETVIYVDSGAGPVDTPIHAHRSVRASGAIGNFGDSGKLDLAVDDEVEVYLVKLTSNGVSRTLTFEHAKLHLSMIGGT